MSPKPKQIIEQQQPTIVGKKKKRINKRDQPPQGEWNFKNKFKFKKEIIWTPHLQTGWKYKQLVSANWGGKYKNDQFNIKISYFVSSTQNSMVMVCKELS